MIHEVNWWDDDLPWDDAEEDENELVLDCGLEGCVMPGAHMRSECHTAEMIEAQALEHEREAFEQWYQSPEGPNDKGGLLFRDGAYRYPSTQWVWRAWCASKGMEPSYR